MSVETLPAFRPTRAPWIKGRSIGQKRPVLPKHVWSIRVRLEMAARLSVERWINDPEMLGSAYLWPSRLQASLHLSTRQYARIMRNCVLSIGLEPIRCDTERSPGFTEKRAICVQCSGCEGTPRWTAPCGISESTWMARCPSRRASTFKAPL
jgi:hypothetical protein